VKTGLTFRVALSHFALAALAILVFTAVVVGIANRELVDTGTRVDRATAWRLAPWMEELYLHREDWRDLERVLRSSPPDSFRPSGERPRMMMERRPAAPFVDRAIVVIDAQGRPVLSTVPIPPGTRLVPEAGVPLGSEADPIGWLFVGSMIFEADNPIRSTLFGTLLRAGAVAAAAVFLGVGLLSLFWARWLLNPIRAVEQAALGMAAGDFSARAPEPSGDHELRSLARSFNAMAREIALQEETRRRFVADAAHELRTPVSLLSARIEMLRDGIYPTDRSQWDALHGSVHRIATLVSDLQTLARLDAGKSSVELHSVPAKRILEEVRDQFLPMAHPRNISIVVQGTLPIGATAEEQTARADARSASSSVSSVEGPVVAVDPGKTQQVLANLVSNAIRHSPEGGEIRLELGVHEGNGSGTVVFAVEDDGPGIPRDERRRVFDRFVRLDGARDRDHGGSGLGLAIAERLVALQDGSIAAVDPVRPGGGARFEVTLPLAVL
jgi:two-component system sensor histidine kinase BaeS